MNKRFRVYRRTKDGRRKQLASAKTFEGAQWKRSFMFWYRNTQIYYG